MKKAYLFTIALLSISLSLMAQFGYDAAVQISAEVQETPPQIRLYWPEYSTDGAYMIYRKAVDANDWGTAITSLANTATEYIDTDVVLGELYEYKIDRGSYGNGYILSGIKVDRVVNRGKIILLVDDRFAGTLSEDIWIMKLMMIGDGWEVIQQNVSPDLSVPEVRAIIKNIYDTHSNVTSLYIFGHVAIPQSGEQAGDGHTNTCLGASCLNDNHQGAWAADGIYADVDGVYTDVSVNNTAGKYEHNHNIPGDGKYDEERLSSAAELEMGRVDLSAMAAFGKTEEELLKRYINKLYYYKNKLINFNRRAIVHNGFGELGGWSPATDTYRHAAAFFGSENITAVGDDEIFTNLANNDYLWAHGDGSGWMQGSMGFGSTDNFVNDAPKAIFWETFGSWYGDWNFSNNFLRAPLASEYGLTNVWHGTTKWFAHHLGMGYTFGYCARNWMNNNNHDIVDYDLSINHKLDKTIHIGLMGDPTLRLDVVAPPYNVRVTPGENMTELITWSSGGEQVGYNIYAAIDDLGPYSKLNNELLTEATYTAQIGIVAQVYMVRAVALTTAYSGSYYNPSIGAFSFDLYDTEDPTVPTGIISLNETNTSIDIAWNPSVDNTGIAAYEVYVDDELLETVSDTIVTLEDIAGGQYDVKIIAIDGPGNKSGESQIYTFTKQVLDLLEVQQFVVLPNPSSGQVSVLSEKDLYLEVVDLQGRILLQVSGSTVDLSSFSEGIYLLKVYAQGQYLGTEKLIKQ